MGLGTGHCQTQLHLVLSAHNHKLFASMSAANIPPRVFLYQPELDDIAHAPDGMAADPERLERQRDRRFDRDEPPPYRERVETVVPTLVLWPTAARKPIRAEMEELVRQPLSDDEKFTLLYDMKMSSTYGPGMRYSNEA